MRLTRVARLCRQIVMVFLTAALIVWVSAAPIVWILRDGLGSGMVETTGIWSFFKFTVQWGAPALALGLPLLTLWLIERRSARTDCSCSISSADPVSQSATDGDSGFAQ